MRVVCDKAKNLPDADWGFISGKSDPYVKLGVGLQVMFALLPCLNAHSYRVVDFPIWNF